MNRPDDRAGDIHESEAATIEVVSLMARMPEFHCVKREALVYLAKLKPRAYKPGEVVIDGSEGSNKNLVIILAGSCDIEKSILIGETRVWEKIGRVHAPAVVGEVRVFSPKPPIAAVVSAQRSLALVVSHEAIIELFRQSEVTLPVMTENFARLSVARCKNTAGCYLQAVNELFGENILDTKELLAKLAQLEAVVESGAKNLDLDGEVFNDLSNYLEWLDHTLALITHIKMTQDFAIPQLSQSEIPEGITLSATAIEALNLGRNREISISQALTETVSRQVTGQLKMENHIGFFLDIIECIEELQSLIPYAHEPDI